MQHLFKIIKNITRRFKKQTQLTTMLRNTEVFRPTKMLHIKIAFAIFFYNIRINYLLNLTQSVFYDFFSKLDNFLYFKFYKIRNFMEDHREKNIQKSVNDY